MRVDRTPGLTLSVILLSLAVSSLDISAQSQSRGRGIYGDWHRIANGDWHRFAGIANTRSSVVSRLAPGSGPGS